MSFSNYPLHFLSYLFRGTQKKKRSFVSSSIEENIEIVIHTYLQIRYAYSLQTFYRLPLEVSMLTLCLVSFFSLNLPFLRDFSCNKIFLIRPSTFVKQDFLSLFNRSFVVTSATSSLLLYIS